MHSTYYIAVDIIYNLYDHLVPSFHSHRFVFLRTCGCVFSERALKEAPSENCHKCGKPFTAGDVLVINGEEDDLKRQQEIMEEAKKQSKVAKVRTVCELHTHLFLA